MRKKHIILLLLILFVGAFLRLWQLNRYPIELFGDEIDVGLQAYSILTTGKDYLGHAWPIMFHSFSEPRLPVPFYITVPTIAAFGLNEWGVRLPDVITGVLDLLLIFVIAKELFSLRVALICLALMGIVPWHLDYSRQSNDATPMLFFFLLGTALLLVGRKRYGFLLASAVVFPICFYTYSAATTFVPLFGLAFALIFKKEFLKFGYAKLTIASLVFAILMIPYTILYFQGSASDRFSKVSVTTNKEIKEEVYQKGKLINSPYKSFFNSERIAYLREISNNYLRAFSTEFLFVHGDPDLRQSVGKTGELYNFMLPLLIVGITSFRALSPSLNLILVWVLFSPVAASLTRDGAHHASRLILLLPALVMISALGFDTLLKSWKKVATKATLFLLVAYGLYNVSFYFYRYYVEWPLDSWKFWNYGFKETMQYTKSIDSKFSKVYFNNTYEPVLGRFLFWYQYDMALFQKQFTADIMQKDIDKYFDGFKVGDKYYFGQVQKPFERLLNPNYLIIASAKDDIPSPSTLQNTGVNLLKTVYSPTGEPIFYILTGKEQP